MGQENIGLAGLNNCGGLWTICVVSSCLVPGPGMIKAGILPPGMCGLHRGGVALNQLVCLSKACPQLGLCFPKTWLAL